MHCVRPVLSSDGPSVDHDLTTVGDTPQCETVVVEEPIWRGAQHRGHGRRGSESNRRPRLCRPLHDHSATPPGVGAAATRTVMRPYKRKGRAGQGSPRETGAGKESRTPDLNLGKVALYQLSYSRGGRQLYHRAPDAQPCNEPPADASPFRARARGSSPFQALRRPRRPRSRCSSN